MLNFLVDENIKALKERDDLTRSVLTSVIANVKKAAIDKGCRDNITDDLVKEVLRKEEKTLVEMVNTCPDSRIDLKEDYQAKLQVLRMYAPKLITDPAEIKSIVLRECWDIDFIPTAKGIIMKKMSSKFKGEIDMKVVQQVVTDLLREGNK
jgi:uncharacterized protein YqeY